MMTAMDYLQLMRILTGNGDPRDDDTDNDGIANYLESSLLDQDRGWCSR